MSKFEKLCQTLKENTNEFINIKSAYLDGYPYVTFIDTDKDVGLSVHGNKDYVEVIYNFDNRERFKNVEDALEFAKEKGHEMYAVPGTEIDDSRLKFAVDDFVNHAYSIFTPQD